MTSPPTDERRQSLLAIPDSRREELLEILGAARQAEHVVLTTHVNADGDGAGSEVAVAAWLEQLGVRATIVNPSPFPPNLRFLLHRDDLVADPGDPRATAALAEADLALVLDTSEPRRIAPVDASLRGVRTLVLDHHPPAAECVGESGVRDPSAAAVGELVYDLITLSADPWPAPAVLGVYVAIVSDTGSFRFSNTTPRVHAIAAEMLSRGVDPEMVFARLFATAPRRRLELLREALANLHDDSRYGIAWLTVPKALTDRLGSTQDDYEGLIEHVRSLEGNRVAILFRETGPTETKISLRSAGTTDVNRIARAFGGGGHVKASGATLSLPLEVAVDRVVEEVRRALGTAPAE